MFERRANCDDACDECYETQVKERNIVEANAR